MALTCCEFIGPAIGDAAAVIVVRTGTGGDVTGLVIYADGCDCGYVDSYSDTYCDPTESGLFPDASITDTSYELGDLPPNAILTIDAVSETVTLTDETGIVQLGGIDFLDWAGLFEWITAAKRGCQAICMDDGDASTNPDTTIEISTYEREW